MSCPLSDTHLAQIGFIVRDIEKTRGEFARFFNVPEPPIVNSGEFSVTKTEYRGEPAPQAQCRMTFFYFGDLQMELIEPNERPAPGANIWKPTVKAFTISPLMSRG